MIDFSNGKVIKLSKSKKPANLDTIRPLLIAGEQIVDEYSAFRDFVIFTNKRLIVVNVQGLTGAKKDFTSLPYSKIQAFSVETAGTFDLDAELELYFSGLGKVKLEFSGTCDIAQIGHFISEQIL
ncbi:MAG: PH domain-containing protein [Bacillota bacterium]|nr:PH domain-containing protein [Bacillota bacterium]